MHHKEAVFLARLALVVILTIQIPAAVIAQEEDPTETAPPPSAEAAFQLYCAPCHGEDGRGDGPLAFGLSTPPPDLTMLTIRNGGRFPREKLAGLIDGREEIKAHTGEREMPVWGEWFRLEGMEGLGGPVDEEDIRMRIEKLLILLESMQQQNP
jgi:hypothetical protein